MKKIYCSLLLFVAFSTAFIPGLSAQSCWAPLGSGITNSAGQSVVYSSTNFNGNLVVGGWFNTANGIAVANIATYNGAGFSALGSGINIEYQPGYFGGVLALAVYNGDLYAGGQFISAGGTPVNNIARWNGTSWSAVGTGILTTQNNNTPVKALAVYNSALYAAGSFDTAGGIVAHNIARWDGNTWTAVAGGVDGRVDCLNTFNGILYAGGSMGIAGTDTVHGLALWNDTSWSAFTGGGVNYDIASMQVYQNNLYVAGDFTRAGGSPINLIAEWNGTNWVSPGGGLGDSTGIVNSLIVYNNELIAAGIFFTANGNPVNSIAAWNGTGWTDVGGVLAGIENDIATLTAYNGNLYSAGQFAHAGTIDATNIAEFTCTSVNGIEPIASETTVHVYPNPTGGIIHFSIENAGAASTIQVYNVLGQRVYQSPLANGKNEVDLSVLAKGACFYRITSGNGQCMGEGTLVLQ